MPQSFASTIYFISQDNDSPTQQLIALLGAKYSRGRLKVKPLLSTPPDEIDFHECDLVIVMLHEGNFPFYLHPIWKKVRDWSRAVTPNPLIVVNPGTHDVDIKNIVDEDFTTAVNERFRAEGDYTDLPKLFKSIVFHVGMICGLKGSRIFISYRRKTGLTAATQVDTFLKEEYAPVLDTRIEQGFGQIWETELKPKLEGTNCLLILDTENIEDSSWVKKEYRHAFARQMPIVQVIWRKANEPQEGRIKELYPLGSTMIIDGDGRGPITEADLARIQAKLDDLLWNEFDDRLRIVEDSIGQFDELEYDTQIRQTRAILLHSHKETNLANKPKRIHSRINVRVPLHELDVVSFANAINSGDHKPYYFANFLVHQHEMSAEELEKMQEALLLQKMSSKPPLLLPIEETNDRLIHHDYVWNHLCSL